MRPVKNTNPAINPSDLVDLRSLTKYLQDLKQDIKRETFESYYPIGATYTSNSLDDSPDKRIGMGTWVRIQGRFIVGASDSDSDFDNGDTGGAKTHTLTNAEMPVHGMSFVIHGQENGTDIAGQGVSGGTIGGSSIARYGNHGSGFTGASSRQTPSWSWGGGNPHNNLPPFKAKYMWERVA